MCLKVFIRLAVIEVEIWSDSSLVVVVVNKSSLAPDIDLEGHDLESVLSYDSDDDDAICGYSEYDNSSESSLDDDDD
ncbi:hypothetical protein F2Q68_00031661 [Brassica cretica]|uniref:Uncharacterized protein n=1 Tax=Brassica cretica TaxID=69181 RepID=A0A8S9GB28_BRACR|nr:hypothetical protein F2Q68_00031661 [Brassica cretica]